MMSRLIAVVIGLGVIGYWLIRARVWLASLMILVYGWRFLSGHPHHGRPVTDAGWFRHGTTALTPTGHAPRWWHRPRWQRMGHRTGAVAALAGFSWLWLASRLAAVLVLCGAALAGAAVAAVVAVQWVRGRKDRRTWLLPAHKALHEVANWPRAKKAASWITVTTEATRIDGDKGTSVVTARLELPSGWPADAKDRERLTARAATVFGIEAAETTGSKWAGPEPVLMLSRSEPPPSRVGWEDVAEAVALAHSNEFVVGLGKKRQVIKGSLSLDSPHFGINMGSGGGKSNLAAFWLMQALHRGAIAMVLDAKWFSHPWLIKNEAGEFDPLPNIAYLSSPAEMHAGMVWLGRELDNRAKIARRSVTASGRMTADVGPPLFVLLEELNLAMPRLRDYWNEIRSSDDLKKSPALTGLGAMSFAGRALKIHGIWVGQMVTADASGSKDSSVKSSIGAWGMGRYGAASWRTAVGDVPMPPVPDVPGRLQWVVGRNVREAQPPLIDMGFAREHVLSGTVTPVPDGMPGAVTVSPARPVDAGPDLPVVTVSPPPVMPAIARQVTLREARELGILHKRTTLDALKMARFRDEEFPPARGLRGTAKVYDAADLAAWDQARRS